MFKTLLHSTCAIFLVFATVSCKSSSPLIPNPYETSHGGSGQKKQRDALGFVPRGFDLNSAPKKIAFGSCSDQELPMPIWNSIVNDKPDLMITMGDNIYSSGEKSKSQMESYKKINQIPEYKKARETIPFLATWDDHDYGLKDGGADFIGKEESRKAFWFQFPYVKDSTLLDQPGIFHSKMMGGVKEGRGKRARTSQSVHVIMLDTRWNRSPLKLAEVKTTNEAKQDADSPPPVKQLYQPEADPKATILGSEQWEWLEDQLKEPSDLKILVSSIQVIADDHVWEKWGNFPKEKEKLYNLIAKTRPKNLIILSGDRHLAAIAKTEIKCYGPVYDITASSFNKAKDGKEKDSTYLFDAYGKENYGLLNIDFPKRNVLVEIKDINGKTVQSVDIKLKK